MSTLLGPQLIHGQSPWPWFDDRHKTLADAFGGWLSSDASRRDDWNTPLDGALSVTKGPRSLPGRHDFPDRLVRRRRLSHRGQAAVVWYTTAGETGRYPLGVKSCDSQTQITLTSPYPLPSESGLRYSRMDDYGAWINGSTNNNYYDNVPGVLRRSYYRTGLTRIPGLRPQSGG